MGGNSKRRKLSFSVQGKEGNMVEGVGRVSQKTDPLLNQNLLHGPQVPLKKPASLIDHAQFYILITWSKKFLLHMWLHEIYFHRRNVLWKVIFWGAGKLKFWKIYDWLQLYFCSNFNAFLLLWWIYLGLQGLDLLLQLFDSLLLLLRLSLGLLPCAELLIKLQGKIESPVCLHAHNKRVQTRRRGFGSGMVPPHKRLQGTSTGTGNTPPCSVAAVYS